MSLNSNNKNRHGNEYLEFYRDLKGMSGSKARMSLSESIVPFFGCILAALGIQIVLYVAI